MKYSEFIFLGMKAGSDYGDPSMNYHSFLLGAANQQDFSSYLDKAFHEANVFLQRASSLGKFPTRIKEFPPMDENADLEMGSDFLKPVAVFQFSDGLRSSYNSLRFKKVGNNVQVVSPFSPNKEIYVQYRPKIRLFGKEDIVFIEPSNQNYETTGESFIVRGTEYQSFADAFNAAEALQIDLQNEYDIPDNLLMIGVDFIRARLNDDVSRGHSQEMEAESRLNDFEQDEFLFVQTKGGRVAL